MKKHNLTGNANLWQTGHLVPTLSAPLVLSLALLVTALVANTYFKPEPAFPAVVQSRAVLLAKTEPLTTGKVTINAAAVVNR